MNLRQSLAAIRAAFTCPTCGKSILVAATGHRGHGTGGHGEAHYGATRFQTVTTDTHCTCPGGPCDQYGLLTPAEAPAPSEPVVATGSQE